MSKPLPVARLGDLLNKSEELVNILPEKLYKQVTVQLWGKGVALRNEVNGSEIAAKRRTFIHSQQFILSRIDARNGAFGIVPDSLEEGVVSNDFPVFNLNSSKIIPGYLGWMCKTKEFIDICKAASEGTTNRVRLKIDEFLESEVPLPEINEQLRIVARIEELAARIEEARELRRRAAEEAETLYKMSYRIMWENCSKGSQFEDLEIYADVIDPQPDHRTPPEVINGMPYVSIANIGIDGDIDAIRARKVSLSVIERQESSFALRTGDIVLGKIGTIGAARPIKVEGRIALSANVVLVQPKRTKILDGLLLALLRAPQLDEQLSKGLHTSAQGAFGIKKMRKLKIPVPTLKEQSQLKIQLDILQSKLDTLRRQQSETAAALDALLPAVLERAFRGEL